MKRIVSPSLGRFRNFSNFFQFLYVSPSILLFYFFPEEEYIMKISYSYILASKAIEYLNIDYCQLINVEIIIQETRD